MSIRNLCYGMLLAACGSFVSPTVNAQETNAHLPKALSDARAARWLLLQHIGNKPMTHNEKETLREINTVISDIIKSSGEDKELPADHTKAQESLEDTARMQHCIELLKKAKDALRSEEDSSLATVRDRSIKNCDDAIRFAERIK